MCSSFKGVLPSDLLEKYTVEGGMNRLEYDLAVLNDIQDQIVASSGEKDGKAMMARNRQRRAAQKQELSDSEAVELLKSGGFI
jgi:hypothetical protein